jgi:hypothetical protein
MLEHPVETEIFVTLNKTGQCLPTGLSKNNSETVCFSEPTVLTKQSGEQITNGMIWSRSQFEAVLKTLIGFRLKRN